MAYTMLAGKCNLREEDCNNDIVNNTISFIRNSCEDLGFDDSMDGGQKPYSGRSIRKGQIPYNMEKDIDRLCLENSVRNFLKSGKKEDAFNVYFCYLEMFVGDYEKTKRMIEFLSEFEENGSGLLMKHRDHYSHSVYVFCLGLAVYESNSIYRDKYKKYYSLGDDRAAAYHYLRYWGLTALFHDIGYPLELPFEQVCSYFEVEGKIREKNPFLSYQGIDSFVKISESEKRKIEAVIPDKNFDTTDELFAYVLAKRLADEYSVDEEQMLKYLQDKPTHPDRFGYYMDHAYFGATILFRKLFGEVDCNLEAEHLDCLMAILLHNSLYKFCVANPIINAKNGMHLTYKDPGNIPFKPETHPLSYMLMLCDELQCWDRIPYGRKTKLEAQPIECKFDFSGNSIHATYLYNERNQNKVSEFKDSWASELKKSIELIVNMNHISLAVDVGFIKPVYEDKNSYISASSFINLYNFAIILNGRWNMTQMEEAVLDDKDLINEFALSFKELSLEYKLSNINQAKAFAKYMWEIGCFYTDRPTDFEPVENFSEAESEKIGHMEHKRWLQEHYDMGWTYGKPDKDERDFLRQHMDMIPGVESYIYVTDEAAEKNYARLDKTEQDKDTKPMECMLYMLRRYDGIRIYRL
jgi:hypothetical protein